jgi:DNA-binding FrmR family transcriptional regulator
MRDEARHKVKGRMNRISGQVTAISRMIDEDKYCIDILNQIAAARSALDALGVELLTEHLEHCVLGHGTGSEHECAKPQSHEELMQEVRTALSRFLKSLREDTK